MLMQNQINLLFFSKGRIFLQIAGYFYYYQILWFAQADNNLKGDTWS